MAVPKNIRLKADFDEWFPQGLYLVGEIAPVTEYQSQEDRARNRPVRPRIDEVTGFPLCRGTFADPSADKDRDKSVTCRVRLRSPASTTTARGGGTVSTGGAGRHDRGAAGGNLRPGQVDHLGHPGHRHDSTRCRGDGHGDICPSEHRHC
ncbi:MAG: hypothetical protein ACRDQH_10160 [Pseudonocardiaceae bacterium]